MKKLISVVILNTLIASSVYADGFYVSAGISSERLKYKSLNAVVLIGYNINQILSAELETSLDIVPGIMRLKETEPPYDTVDYKISHTSAFTKFILPISGPIEPFARIGLTEITTEVMNNKQSETNFSYGFGAIWTMFEKLGLRVDYTIINIDTKGNGSEDIFSVSTVYSF